MGTISTFRALATDMMARSSLARMAGVTFGGKRDLYDEFGYDRDLTPTKYRDRYRRNAVAGRVVESAPNATWRGGGELVEDENVKKTTAFEDAWMTLEDRLHVWATFLRADILAGLGRYSIILIGGPGLLDQPLERASIDTIQYLTPFSEEDATINTYETDDSQVRFGQPLTYALKRLTPDKKGKARIVHWTRCLHIADGLLDDHVFGRPRLERVWNLLDDLEKVTGGGAESFYQRANQGLLLNLDKDFKFKDGEEQKFKDEVDEYRSKISRVLKLRGVEAQMLGSDVANFNGPTDAIIKQISAGTGIPQRLLMGSERGELASTQDRDNWFEHIGDRRTGYANPLIVRPFVDRLVGFGALPEPSEYEVVWSTMQNTDDNQKAELADKMAAANQKQGEDILLTNEIRDMVWGKEPLEEPEVEPVPQPQPGDPGLPIDDPANPAMPPGLVAAKRRLRLARQLARNPRYLVDHQVSDVRVSASKKKVPSGDPFIGRLIHIGRSSNAQS